MCVCVCMYMRVRLNKLNHDNLFNHLSKLFLLHLSKIFLDRILSVKPALKVKKAIINETLLSRILMILPRF